MLVATPQAQAKPKFSSRFLQKAAAFYFKRQRLS
jgi:hypothetical protein